jgi:hypothetical protein
MGIICQSQCRKTTSSDNRQHTCCNQISCAKRALSFGWKSFVSTMSETHPSSELGDIPTAIVVNVNCAKRALSFRMEFCQSQCRNTSFSEIGDIRAAIESVAPSMHCRSGGNRSSVTIVETRPLLKLATYPLQSNQLRQACIVVRMESFVNHNVF